VEGNRAEADLLNWAKVLVEEEMQLREAVRAKEGLMDDEVF